MMSKEHEKEFLKDYKCILRDAKMRAKQNPWGNTNTHTQMCTLLFWFFIKTKMMNFWNWNFSVNTKKMSFQLYMSQLWIRTVSHKVTFNLEEGNIFIRVFTRCTITTKMFLIWGWSGVLLCYMWQLAEQLWERGGCYIFSDGAWWAVLEESCTNRLPCLSLCLMHSLACLLTTCSPSLWSLTQN